MLAVRARLMDGPSGRCRWAALVMDDQDRNHEKLLARGVVVLMSLITWLTQPVVEHHEDERPFRLRRASVLLLGGGWVVFLISCLAGIVIVRQHVPIVGWADLLSGPSSLSSRPGLQWTRTVCEAIGAVSFFAGLASVALFDRRDGVRVRTTR